MIQRCLEIAAVFSRLGCTSFGGPIAHLGYLRAELVQRRNWLDDAHYADIVALCQFLPGPASSQVVFALGMLRAGLLGALVASLCFTLPSALLMIGFAYGVAKHLELQQAGWLHGLKLAAVAVVAQAVWGMGKKLCSDPLRKSLCIATGALLLAWPNALVQLGAIAAGALVGWRAYASQAAPVDAALAPAPARRHALAAGALLLFALLLVFSPVLAAASGIGWLTEFDSFYRAGSLVFGGGHVVLPLLRAEVVPRGWVSEDQFLAGYGAAQALPGPLFTFAAYLGTVMGGDDARWQHGLLCLLAIFLPAWLLVGGALPFWQQLRERAWAQAALAGANASVVGVLLAAFYSPVFVQSVHTPLDAAAALVAFGVLESGRAPPWLVVISMAGLGQWWLPR
jgi:chromate transporter